MDRKLKNLEKLSSEHMKRIRFLEEEVKQLKEKSNPVTTKHQQV
jgi:hypothetical protein